MTTAAVMASLLSRVSVGELTEPAPAGDALEQIFQAAVRAPDHGLLKPWRFVTVEGEARRAMGEIIAEVEHQTLGPLSESQYQKAQNRLLRAPLVVMIVCQHQPHTKVPLLEQQLSCACAVQNMLHAAHALGFGAMWRSGLVTFKPLLAERLGLQPHESLLGFVYLGTPVQPMRTAPDVNVNEFISVWQP